LTIAFTITALLLGIIGAVAAGTGTVTPPPKIAFVTTNANVAPDALTVGPMAGRLGAPLFITNKDTLGEDTKNALVAYGADLIIVAGGPNTVTDGVLAQIAAATGLTIEEFDDKPTSGIIRAFGSGRDQTAAKLSELIANYNPKFLPTDATATDADLLDGKDSTEFLGAAAKAADADKLDGIDSSAFVPLAGITVEAATQALNAFLNAADVELIEFEAPTGGWALLEVQFACASFDGTTSTRWNVNTEVDDTAVFGGTEMILVFDHGSETGTPGETAAWSGATQVTAGTHSLTYTRTSSSGDGSIDCNIHSRVVVLPV